MYCETMSKYLRIAVINVYLATKRFQNALHLKLSYGTNVFKTLTKDVPGKERSRSMKDYSLTK